MRYRGVAYREAFVRRSWARAILPLLVCCGFEVAGCGSTARPDAGGEDAGSGNAAATKALKDIKLMKEDAAGVEKQSEEIKKRYTQLFKV